MAAGGRFSQTGPYPAVGFPPQDRRILPLAWTPPPWDGGLMFTSRGSRPALLCVVCSLATLAVAAPGASAAAQRYASPSGGGYACSSAVPCDLTYAIEGAAGGGEGDGGPGGHQGGNNEQPSPDPG